MLTSAKFRDNLNLQQFKVTQGRWFWYQSKAHIRVPISHHFGPILHRFWDTLTYLLKIAYTFIPLSYSAPPLAIRNFAVKLSVRKTESWGYSVVKVAWS